MIRVTIDELDGRLNSAQNVKGSDKSDSHRKGPVELAGTQNSRSSKITLICQKSIYLLIYVTQPYLSLAVTNVYQL